MNANTLTTTDHVIASIEVNGRILASVSKSNFSSLQEVAKFLIAMAGKYIGLAKLTIRNKTQGWTTTMAYAMRNNTPAAMGAMGLKGGTPRDGLQYRLW